MVYDHEDVTFATRRGTEAAPGVVAGVGARSELPTNELDDLAGRWRDRYGFELHLAHLVLPGRCSGCADENGRMERTIT